MSKGHNLQDPFLNALRKERIPVSIFLVNGIKLQGQIESFDQFVVLLKNTDCSPHVIYLRETSLAGLNFCGDPPAII